MGKTLAAFLYAATAGKEPDWLFLVEVKRNWKLSELSVDDNGLMASVERKVAWETQVLPDIATTAVVGERIEIDGKTTPKNVYFKIEM